ncbi:Ribonuclease III domain-containing protein RNC1, chloroplastic, partial [Cucurbita argyrosperma subsp. sororia]
MRERVFALIGKRNLPKWIKAASLQNLIFPYDDMDKLIRKDREPPVNFILSLRSTTKYGKLIMQYDDNALCIVAAPGNPKLVNFDGCGL